MHAVVMFGQNFSSCSAYGIQNEEKRQRQTEAYENLEAAAKCLQNTASKTLDLENRT